MHSNLLQCSRFPVYGESACVLKGRHGGLVGTKALGEEDGHVCCMVMHMGLCLTFCVFFCKPVDAVEEVSLWACCSDGGVSDVGVGGG
jgi:hypothetical protein